MIEIVGDFLVLFDTFMEEWDENEMFFMVLCKSSEAHCVSVSGSYHIGTQPCLGNSPESRVVLRMETLIPFNITNPDQLSVDSDSE